MSNPISMNTIAFPISFEQVQQATARCLQVHPAVDAVLPKESFALVELMGRMIYARSEAVDAACLPQRTLDELRRWTASSALRAAA